MAHHLVSNSFNPKYASIFAINGLFALSTTSICERFGCFGGVITTVGMETLAWYRYEGCVNDTEVSILFCYFFLDTTRKTLFTLNV